jgi:hypothetical protein
MSAIAGTVQLPSRSGRFISREITSSNHSVGEPVSTIDGLHIFDKSKSVLSLPGIETRIVQLKA